MAEHAGIRRSSGAMQGVSVGQGTEACLPIGDAVIKVSSRIAQSGLSNFAVSAQCEAVAMGVVDLQSYLGSSVAGIVALVAAGYGVLCDQRIPLQLRRGH